MQRKKPEIIYKEIEEDNEDETRIKRPHSAFNIFTNQCIKKLREESPHLSKKQERKEMNKIWKGLTEKQR